MPTSSIFFEGEDGTDSLQVNGSAGDDIIDAGSGSVTFSTTTSRRTISYDTDVENVTLVSSAGGDQVSIWDGTIHLAGTTPWGSGSTLNIDAATVTSDVDFGSTSSSNLT